MMDAFDRAVEREAQSRRASRTRPPWRRLAIHLRSYVLVNIVLVAVWWIGTSLSNETEPWFVHVLWGWGIGLLVHYLVVTQVTRRWRPPPHTGTQPGYLEEGDR